MQATPPRRSPARADDAEARLRASEESYRTLFELAGDAMFVHDVATGAILDANRKACEMHGCTLAELKALGVGGISDGRPPYDAAHAKDYIERAVAGEPQRFEWLVRRASGERFWVEVSLHRVQILGQDRVLASVRNIDQRKHTEDALREAHAALEARVEERTAALAARTAELEAVFRALPDLYFRMAPDGTFLDYRAGRQFGLYAPPEAFLGRRVSEILPPPVAGRVDAALAEVGAHGDPVDIEYTLPLGDERRDFEARLLPLDGSAGSEVVAVVRDVTARVQAEEALRASEDHFRRLIENATDLISIVDPEGAVRYQSPSVERVLGYAPGSFSGGGVFERVHPDDLPAVRTTLEAALAAAGTPHRVTFRFRHADGTWRVLEATGQTMAPDSPAEGVVVNSRDVTERVAAERALQFQKALLEAGDEASLDGLLVVGEDGRVLSHNRRFTELWGLPPGTLAGGGVLDALLAQIEDPACTHATLDRVRAHPEVEARATVSLRDGRVFDSYTAPVRGRTGERFGRIWSFRDATTEVRRAEELEAAHRAAEAALADLRQAQTRLVQQEKLAGLGRMAAGIAHELKNPLNFVTNFALLSVDLAAELRATLAADPARPTGEALAAAVGVLDDLAENASKIAAHGRRADDIVRAMMAHARGPAAARASVDVNAVVAEHVALAADGWRSRTGAALPALTLDLADDTGSIDGVAPELGRVVVNLVTNALDAVAGGPGAHVAVRTRRAGGAVELAVEDSGPGIPEADRSRIFEPFFTTKPAGAGNVGLGLSLTREVVEDGHGGRLDVKTRAEGGAVFTARLPALAPPDTQKVSDPAFRPRGTAQDEPPPFTS